MISNICQTTGLLDYWDVAHFAYENEIEVLKSRTTAERVIKSLLESDHKNNLHLFNTRDYDDTVIQKILRKILFLD